MLLRITESRCKTKYVHSKITRLATDLAVIIQIQPVPSVISLHCGLIVKIIQEKAAIVQFPNCTIFINEEVVAADINTSIIMTKKP